MRARPSRPASRDGASPPIRSPAARPVRKIFNCIIDDSALVAGVKKSTRNGIRQWVKNGQIRLFVPLHALDELSRQKNGKSRHADDVRETLTWLDDATSKHPDAVALQGGDETFERWSQVEKFAVPRTLFSEFDHDHVLDHESDTKDTADDTTTKLTVTDGDTKAYVSSEASEISRSLSPASLDSARSSASPVSPPSSPVKSVLSSVPNIASLAASTGRPQSASDSMPVRLQPLFNYILWRVHQELDPVAALESFIFLCNDDSKVNFAKGFDIKTKRLEQLREAVGREDREFKNRQGLLEREEPSPATPEPATALDDAEDDEVVFKPPSKAPAAMLVRPPANVIDPDDFGRGTPIAFTEQVNASPKSPRMGTQMSRGSPRGSKTLPFIPRGNARGVSRGAARGRGNVGGGRGGHAAPIPSAENTTPAGQIDPDSFSRPVTRNGPSGVRGARKLWVPS